MTKPISRRQHAATDYSYVPLVSLAPGLAGFQDEPAAARLCRVASGVIAVSTLLTRAEWGTVKVMPYKAHLARRRGARRVHARGALAVSGSPGTGPPGTRSWRWGPPGLSAGLLSEPDEMPPADR